VPWGLAGLLDSLDCSVCRSTTDAADGERGYPPLGRLG
jgi:hypothetical protein